MAATPTATEITRLRRQLGLSETKLPEAEIEAMYTEAGEQYPEASYSRAIWFAAVRLQAQEGVGVHSDLPGGEILELESIDFIGEGQGRASAEEK